MDRLTAAKVFVDVAYSGSFTASAKRLGMSRPMVSRYVESMEDWLKIRLFHRSTRKISLTNVGEACLKDVEKLLAEADNLTSLFISGAELQGIISIATNASFSKTLMPAVIDFMTHNPKIKVNFDCRDTVVDLVEQRIDLAIRIGSDIDPELVGRPIAICDSVLVASPKYLRDNPKINTPDDLSGHSCLGYGGFDKSIWFVSSEMDLKPKDFTCRISSNEVTTLLHAVLNHAGISTLPNYLANSYIDSGELEVILPDVKLYDLNINAVISSIKNLSPEVSALIDHLEMYFKENPW